MIEQPTSSWAVVEVSLDLRPDTPDSMRLIRLGDKWLDRDGVSWGTWLDLICDPNVVDIKLINNGYDEDND